MSDAMVDVRGQEGEGWMAVSSCECYMCASPPRCGLYDAVKPYMHVSPTNMKFATALTALLFGAATQLASAAPTVESRDVWTPPILYPHNGTVWRSGDRHNITW